MNDNDSYLVPLVGAGRCSRRHALRIFAAGAASVVCGGPLSRRPAAAPWGERQVARRLNGRGSPLSLGVRKVYEPEIRQADPTLVVSPNGQRLWTAWTGLHEAAEGILLRSFSPADERWGPIVPVSEADGRPTGVSFQSEIAFIGERLVIVWSHSSGRGWSLSVRSYDPAADGLGPVHRIAGSVGPTGIHWKPAIAANGERGLVVWQAKDAGADAFRIFGCRVSPDGQPVGEPFEIAGEDGRDCCRPAVAPAPPDGARFAVAYDRQDGPGTQNIYLRFVDGRTARCTAPIAASAHPASDVTPALAPSPDGKWLWVGWHSNRRGPDGWDLPRWYRLAALRLSDKTWHQPVSRPAGRDPDGRGTVQGFELVRLCVAPSGLVCVLGRPSHNFCLQYYTGDEETPLYRLPEDGWGGRGRFLRGVFDGRGSLWVTRRDLRTNVLHRIDGFDPSMAPPALEPCEEPTRPGRRSLVGIAARYARPEPVRAALNTPAAKADAPRGLNLYFGDIHGHSWQSDGMGEPEESFLRARDVLGDDFHALTDHDRFVGKRLLDAQWQEQKDIADHYHAPGRFVTLYAQEWTTPRINRPHGYGHFNIYSADPAVPLFDHGDPRYRDLEKLYPLLREHGAVAIPHHIGWTGVPWDRLDPDLTPAVEICSVHGAFEYEGNEPIRHRGGLKGCFVRDGLAAGLRFGLVGGSDQHGLLWHHGVCWKRNAYRAGLTGVWATELTRRAVLDAIRARRTFATTGVKLCLRFAVNEAGIGSQIRTDGPPALRVDVAVPPEEGKLAWLHIVRDGVVVHRYGGEGQRSRYTFVDEGCPRGSTSYYYLRVILQDRNMAWSSPIWVTRG